MEPDFEELKNEVLRKVGRNVLLFQQFEVMLKFLVTHGKLSGYVSDLENVIERRKARVMKQTLGRVAGQFLEEAHGEQQEVDEDYSELKEKGLHISYSVQIQSDEEQYLATEKNLERIIKERNELIHHFVINFNLNTIEGLAEAERYLDEQREALLPEHEKAKRYLKTYDEARKAFIKSVHPD